MNRIGRLLLAALLGWLLTGCVGDDEKIGQASDTPVAAASVEPGTDIRTNARILSASPAAVQMVMGQKVTLDGSNSRAASGSTITRLLWTLVSRPEGSKAAVPVAMAAVPRISFIPDVAGSYVVRLTVTDSRERSASQSLTLVVNSGAPVLTITNKVDFTGSTDTRPAQSVSVGSMITLDGSASTSAAGSPPSLAWDLLQRPPGSQASLTTVGSITHFSADTAGTYQVQVRGTDAAGRSATAIYTYNAVADQPALAIATRVTPQSGETAVSLEAATGDSVLLDSSASAAPADAGVTSAWTLLERPAGSASALSAATGAAVSFVPDVAGTYKVSLSRSAGTNGAAATGTVTVNVRPGVTAVITGQAQPVALVSAPQLVSSKGVPVTLRGSGSYVPGGGALTYRWSVDTRPAGSTAAITRTDLADITFTPDADGKYTLKLTTTNALGDSAVRSVSLFVGNYPPVVVLDREAASVAVGSTLTVSAANSQSQSGKALSFRWSIDARPAGSAAAIADPAAAVLRFTPDVAGTYYASVTVTEGAVSSVVGLGITATAASGGSGAVTLDYKPLITRYSLAQDKAVIVSTAPNALHLVTPGTGADKVVSLPAAVKALSLSPDGRWAAVLHEGAISLIDVPAGRLVRSSSTAGAQTSAMVSNAGRVYLTGQSGGQWVDTAFTVIDGSTGTVVQTQNDYPSQIYGTTFGVLADQIGRIFTRSYGLSPGDIVAHKLDAGGLVTGAGIDSPYHGDYPMGDVFWLSSDQSLLFTSAGTYFQAETLRYQGTLGVYVRSMSHSMAAQEAVALSAEGGALPSAYKRYTGSLLFPTDDVPLPTVSGAQAYGLQIFHGPGGRIVLLAQTGSAQEDAASLRYHLLVR